MGQFTTQFDCTKKVQHNDRVFEFMLHVLQVSVKNKTMDPLSCDISVNIENRK